MRPVIRNVEHTDNRTDHSTMLQAVKQFQDDHPDLEIICNSTPECKKGIVQGRFNLYTHDTGVCIKNVDRRGVLTWLKRIKLILPLWYENKRLEKELAETKAKLKQAEEDRDFYKAVEEAWFINRVA